jgi:MFS family permease
MRGERTIKGDQHVAQRAAAVGVLEPAATGAAELQSRRICQVQRRILVVLVLTQILGGAGVGAGVAIAALSATRLSGSDVVGGLALMCTAAGAALTAVSTARIAVRAGRRSALLVGYLSAAVGAVAAAAAVEIRSWPLLLLASVPLGAATATNLAARYAGTDLAAPHRRGRALGTVLGATTLGIVIGPNLADPAQRAAVSAGLAADAGPYLVCTATFGLAALGVLAGLRPDPLRLAGRLAAATDVPPPATRPGRRWTPQARLALATISVAQLVMVGVMSMAPVHMGHGGAELRMVGIVISFHTAGMYALSPVFGCLADRRGRIPVLAAGAGVLAVAFLVAGTAGPHDMTMLSFGLFLLGLGWSAALVSGSALLVDAVPPTDRPGVQGRADLAVNLSGALGGGLAGLVMAATSYAVLNALAALLAAIVLAAVLRVGRPATRSLVSSRIAPAVPCGDAAAGAGVCPR